MECQTGQTLTRQRRSGSSIFLQILEFLRYVHNVEHSKYPNHKSELIGHLNMDISEIFNTQTRAPKQRCDQVSAGSKHHLPIIIHPPYLYIRGISQ